jgi:hypothetical protein
MKRAWCAHDGSAAYMLSRDYVMKITCSFYCTSTTGIMCFARFIFVLVLVCHIKIERTKTIKCVVFIAIQ